MYSTRETLMGSTVPGVQAQYSVILIGRVWAPDGPSSAASSGPTSGDSPGWRRRARGGTRPLDWHAPITSNYVTRSIGIHYKSAVAQ